MPRSSFTETTFTCAACGARFKALSGPTPPPVVVCGDCGLSRSPAQVRKAIEARKPPKPR